jgi:hypothetical protein
MKNEVRKPELAQIRAEYQRATAYKQRIGLYETVRQNENFFLGRQWEGVNAPDLEKPVNNIIRRIVTYAIAQIVSDDVSASLLEYRHADKQLDAQTLEALEQEIGHVIERLSFTAMGRQWLRDAAVDGDACAYFYWDAKKGNSGEIACETVDNTQVIFGNPATGEVQKQPYMILPMRCMVQDVKRQARENGLPDDDIRAESGDGEQPNEQQLPGDDQTTVLVRLWRQEQTGTIWCCKVTNDAWVRLPWDTGLKLYPLAYFSWDKVKNSCHGQAFVTSAIPNQIAINKLQAMLIKGVKDMAFPKIVYDATKIERWNNRVGEAIATIGDPNVAVARVLQGAAISPQVQQLVTALMDLTKDTMGASDAALGNVRPDNTSAIIAVQKAAAAPLELQRRAYFQFVEECVRIMVDMMHAYYGVRTLRVLDEQNGQWQETTVDFSLMDQLYQRLTVHVGPSAYWSELTQLQTADNLLEHGLMDGETYVRSIPDLYIRNKQGVLAYNRQKRQQEQQMAGAATAAGMASAGPEIGAAAGADLPQDAVQAILGGANIGGMTTQMEPVQQVRMEETSAVQQMLEKMKKQEQAPPSGRR